MTDYFDKPKTPDLPESNEDPDALLSSVYHLMKNGGAYSDAIQRVDQALVQINEDPNSSSAQELEAKLLRLTLLVDQPVQSRDQIPKLISLLVTELSDIRKMQICEELGATTTELVKIQALSQSIFDIMQSLQQEALSGIVSIEKAGVTATQFLGVWEHLTQRIIDLNELISQDLEIEGTREQRVIALMSRSSLAMIQRRTVGEYPDITAPIPYFKLQDAMDNFSIALQMSEQLRNDYPDPSIDTKYQGQLDNLHANILLELGVTTTKFASVEERSFAETGKKEEGGDWEDILKRGMIPLLTIYGDMDILALLRDSQVIDLEFSLGYAYFLLGEIENCRYHLEALLDRSKLLQEEVDNTLGFTIKRAATLLSKI